MRAVFRPLLLAGLLALVAACATTPPPPGPDRVPPALQAAPAPLSDDARVREVLLTRDGTRLPVQSWLPDGPPRAVILALHGLNDYANAFDAPGHWWAERGVATYAYDQRGFGRNADAGRWPGIPRLGDDVADAAAALRRRWPDTPLYLLGESMGGAVLLATYAGEPLPPGVRGLILAAPAVWSRATMPFYQRWALAVAHHTVPWLALSPPRGLIHIQASDNIPMMVALGRDPLVIKPTRVEVLAGISDLMDAAMAAASRLDAPALVQFGEHEQLIPEEPRAKALARIPVSPDGPPGSGPRLAYYPEGWHMLLRDLHARIVWQDVLAWIDDPAAPLPSGADINPHLTGLLAQGRTANAGETP